VGQGKTATQWRLNKLDDLLLYADASPQIGALVARDKRILSLTLTLPTAVSTWVLVARDKTRVNQWLKPA
jgi:hypothetical protein